MKKPLVSILTVSLITACTTVAATSDKPANSVKADTPKNIIMVVADGMGPAYTTAYRYFADNPATPEIEKTVFDRHFVGMASTYPAPVSGYITDSAAAATALATGVKTYNDAISVDVNKKPLETVLERAKKLGKKTGVVVTSQVNHATPASYLTHNEFRRNYNEIADSYIDNGIKADIYLGGGWRYFIREDRNLVQEFKDKGFHYIDKYDQLGELPKNTPILGLFGNTGLPWALDDIDNYRLSTMTKSAIKQIENEQGYFILIEASQVDWGGHANDIAAAMHEMDDLAKTIEFLEQYVKSTPDTLVVLTADHSTGGLSIGRRTGYTDANIKSKYLWQPEILRSMSMSPEAFSKAFIKQDFSNKQMSEMLNFELTDEEFSAITSSKSNGNKVIKQFELTPKADRQSKYPPSLFRLIAKSVREVIDVRTNTGWGGISDSATHTGVDVPVFAFGKGKDNFGGAIDNTDIAKEIFKLLEQ